MKCKTCPLEAAPVDTYARINAYMGLYNVWLCTCRVLSDLLSCYTYMLLPVPNVRFRPLLLLTVFLRIMCNCAKMQALNQSLIVKAKPNRPNRRTNLHKSRQYYITFAIPLHYELVPTVALRAVTGLLVYSCVE